MMTFAKQIGANLEAAEKSKNEMEQTLGEKLRAVALAVQSELDPHIDNVTNEQLIALSKKLDVDNISLWKRTVNDIVVLKSSAPEEINQSSKTWDYWYTAFNQLFDLKSVTVPKGQTLAHYWSGPYQYSTTDPSHVNKWGNYYDGTTDYMINPYVNAQVFLDYENNTGTNSIIRRLLADNPDILEVSGFDPEFFGKPEILKIKKGKIVRNLDVRPVPFGEYKLKDEESDAENVREAVETGQSVTSRSKASGKSLLKSFIPLNNLGKPLVVGVSFDYSSIRASLNHQLFVNCMISLCLVVAAWIVSYVIAGFLIRPLRYILDNVNELAKGKFGSPIAIRRWDELGHLTFSVNTMANNLQSYMGRLKDSAEELRSTKEYLESFFKHTSDAIHVTDLDGKVIQVNDAFETMFGWSSSEVLHHELKHVPDNQMSEYAAIRGRIKQGESITDFETMRQRKDGQFIDVSITVSPIRGNQDEIVAIAEICRNITARKQSDEVIRRTEKLSVIGQLAAGVAHEIRNPLTTLRGFVQLNKQQGSLSPAYLDIMLSELERINFIVSEFLVLAKPQVNRYQPIDIRRLLDDMIALLDSQANLINVKFERLYGNDVPMLVCEENQLKQVFLNVIKNSIEAMEGIGGTITIELDYAPSREAVVIRFIDEGRGISEEDMARLGEPFFTRKATGNGLGLMVSQRIIANHKGTMQITSKQGEGTCVEIRLSTASK
ncbi:PAS domain S-box protein [Cohnella endophytica]|uniref:histidine kinase n=2 Tax=Cohnella endophytica TaxID=2419778 RepID=A0A494YE64_9BACL|nr:PAS domain S-box protein [Cohnella endophytica]